MSNEGYRQLYAKFLRLFPTGYRERFAESMEQTFSDVLQEQAIEKRNVASSAAWMFVETSVGIMKQQIIFFSMKNINLLFIFGAVAAVLMIPLVAMQFDEGWNWTWSDFLFAGVVLSTAGLLFELISRRGGTLLYRAAVGLAVAAGLMLFWVNAAVGLIGEDQPANLMYAGVLLLAILSLPLTRLQPRALSWAMLIVAAAQVAVPVIAYIVWPEVITAELYRVIGISAFFFVLWTGSALLFRLDAENK